MLIDGTLELAMSSLIERPTEDIVSSVEVVLTNEREPPEWTKDTISKRVSSALQSAFPTNCYLNKNGKGVCILMTD